MGHGGWKKAAGLAAGLALGGGVGYVIFSKMQENGGEIEVQKSINIGARPERVFDFWTDYENFPDWMSHVRSVENLDGVRSRWKVDGPAGAPVQWTAALTDVRPNKLIAWKTVPGALVRHSGCVTFKRNQDGSTHVDVTLRYSPPGGLMGHFLASLFGKDPRTEMDDDLLRLKSLIETGVPAHDAAGAHEEDQEQNAGANPMRPREGPFND